MRVPGNDDPDARRCRRAHDRSNLEHSAAYPFSLCPNSGEIRTTLQSLNTWETKPATLLRTSTAASLSGAYAPSCGAGSVPPAPISLTCEGGIRVSGFSSCFLGCTSAFPSLTPGGPENDSVEAAKPIPFSKIVQVIKCLLAVTSVDLSTS